MVGVEMHLCVYAEEICGFFRVGFRKHGSWL